ncbi:unnamed protein product [Heligmosomoides polygyrus]|uniref:Amidinotransferase n=1 Tax=Heligmosomoides polygyrus TaxID=6339 RepID=A0A3P8G7S0_HELPZ|nr:unnamed protein product [Heligmosomoides polygyrus]
MNASEDAKELPDLVFTANAGIVRGKQVYLANFAHQQRKAEWKINEKWFRKNGFRTHYNPNIPQEGAGDAVWCCDKKVLIAGVGPRSDVRALTDIHDKLCSPGDEFRVVAVKLVDPRFYHLDTCFCPLNNEIALYFPKAFDPVCRHNLSNYLDLLPVCISSMTFGINSLSHWLT